VERSAAAAFRGSAQDAIADDAVSPVEFYIPFQTDGLVLVAEDADAVVGFAACQACADALHLWELAVRHDRQGQGIGRQLVRACADLARRRSLSAVTLSTFRDIPWNGPFYRGLGFSEVAREQLNPRLAAIRRREAELGLDVEARCAMRLAL
jgi:ribosomal protein S18 acetylase RimI-like enzyme